MWIVSTSSAHMPNSCKGTYRNVALLKLSQHYAANDLLPKMLSIRARGVLDIVHLGHHNVGSTARCAYQRALRRADQMAKDLNAQSPIAQGEYLMSWGGSA
jgi:hypothetical protein